MRYSRRRLLQVSAAALAFPKNLAAYHRNLTPIELPTQLSATEIAQNEGFWSSIAQHFDADKRFINLENGYYGIMPIDVHQNYLHNTLRLNRHNSHLLRSTYKEEAETVRKQLATILGVSREEIAFSRGGTEALQNLIAGYNKLEPGDQVMYADLDYYSCQYAFKWLEQRRKVTVVKISIPEPAQKQAILDCYAQALEDHPHLKLLLLTHLNNRTGLVVPVAEIVSMARRKGVDVIVDVAHSLGQIDFKLEDLQADFIGMSMHKWMHAPLGLGCLYVRKNRLADIDPCFGDETYDCDDIRARVHSGTLNIAPLLTLPTALAFHLNLGAAVKQERLRYLRNHWVSRVKSLDSLQILTPEDPNMHGGITSFRLRGRPSSSDNEKIATFLFKKHGIFSVVRGGIMQGDCIRITPALFTSAQEVESLANALVDLVKAPEFRLS